MRILNQSPGKITRFLEADGKYAIETIRDVEPILEHAKALHNEGKWTRPNGDRHLARVPIVVLDSWAKRRGLGFDDVMRDVSLLEEFLADPEHSYFLVDKR
jgi:hypothetical protein